MGISRINSHKKVFAQLVLLALPTLFFISYLLWRLNVFYSILQNDWVKQSLFFTSGLIISILFYAYRFRFLTTALLVVFVNYIIYKILGTLSVGEFDAFYYSVQFLIFSILFSLGWLAGFGFSRSRNFTVLWSVLLLVIQIMIVSSTAEVKVDSLIKAFVPALAYAFYIIYTAELIRNMNENEGKFSWFIVKRLSGFALILLLVFFLVFNLFKSDFQAVERDWGGSSSQNDKEGGREDESMTQKDKNGGVSNKDQTKLSGSLNKDKQLIFVAKLDNYFEDGRTPNPLYFTSHYFTKFDTATQTFEKDPKMPYNDLYLPDPSKIPLYFPTADTSIIRKSLGSLDRKIASAEVYKVNLAADKFLAPSTAYYCQPISVPKEFREQFRSAYRAKMWVSELNSAYFIYNPAGNWRLEAFQQRRFDKLRDIKKIKGPDKKFMDYYTYMPRDEEYKRIGILADSVTRNAEAPIDKIIAIRDYFLSKDMFGQPLFAYSDNPGIPGIPSANKLTYFLLENRKGYCAYFAGATLFMLRSLGIPSRLVAGYLTEDRSSKNPGWYWFYQDQAHAWVQVYFQGYGWIDFDTTVPDVNTRQAAQPDGTPPTDVPEIYFVADGEVLGVDTVKKTIDMKTKKILFHDKDYESSTIEEVKLDVSIAAISMDTGEVRLAIVKKGMHITAVSHAEALKNIETEESDDLAKVIAKLPEPVPVDEVKIFTEDMKQKEKDREKEKQKIPVNWNKIIVTTLLSICGLVILFFLSPFFIWIFFNAAARRDNDRKAYNRYRASLFYLYQLGFPANEKGPQQHADEIDRKFGTNFSSFSHVYQKLKYSTVPLSENERKIVSEFYPAFVQKVKKQVPLKTRIGKFLNVYNTLHYFSTPKIK